MTMITPSYLGETIEYSSLHACRSTLEDPTGWVHSPYRGHAATEAPAFPSTSTHPDRTRSLRVTKALYPGRFDPVTNGHLTSSHAQ